MSKLELKSAFIMSSSNSTKLMRNFLTTEMKIETTQEWLFGGRVIIDVPKKDYERVLLEGQQYVIQQNIPYISWVNYYGALGACGYLQLAYAILDGREGKYSWSDDEYLPEDILEYLKGLREALGVEVRQSYRRPDRAFCLQPQSLDYQKQLELMSAFVEKEGYGPFDIIRPMTFTGELKQGTSFPVKIKK